MPTIRVKAREATYHDVEREVELPAYGMRWDDYDDAREIIETRWVISADLTRYRVMVKMRYGEVEEVEFGIDKIEEARAALSEDFGTGWESTCDAGDFHEVLAKARAFLARFPEPEGSR